MAKFDWYKRNPAKFFGGTIGFTFDQKAGYGLVLDLIYDKEGKLPDDARWIAGVMGLSVRRWKAIRGDLIRLGKLYLGVDGCLHNSVADTAFTSSVDRAIIEERPILPTRSFQDKIAEKEVRSNEINDLEGSLARAGASARESQSQSQNQNNNKRGPLSENLSKIDRLSAASGVNLTTHRNAHLLIEQTIRLEDEGIDFEKDLLPAVDAWRQKTHGRSTFNGISYFGPAAREKRDQRLLAEAIEQNRSESRKTLSREQWVRGFEKFLECGYWLGDLGLYPTEAKPDAPVDIYERALAAWNAQGQKPKVIDSVVWPHKQPVPFFVSNVVQLKQA